MKRKLLIIIMAIPLVCSVLHANDPRRVDQQQARSLFAAYLKGAGKIPGMHVVKLKPVGKSTWMIHCYSAARRPQLPWRHVMDARGAI